MISRVIRSVVILFLSLVCFGCRESKVEIVAHENYWRGGPPKELGALSENEVAAIRVKLNGVQFPAPEWTIQRLLPSTLKPVPAAFFDAGIADPKGRIGGVIQDYWLNSKSVLRVATAYYSIGEKHYSLEEWAELMTPKQAYQPVSRSPYSK